MISFTQSFLWVDNKKKCLFIFFFVLLFNITYISNSHSQSNIAILDVLTLLKESKAAKSMKDQLDKVAKEYSDAEKKKAKEIQKKEEELLRQKSTLTPEAFSDRKNAFEKTVIEFNKTRDTNRRALAKAERESMVKIESAVEKIVKEIQTAEKIDVVIKKTAVILSEDSIDITSKVIEKLNKEVSTIDVNVTP